MFRNGEICGSSASPLHCWPYANNMQMIRDKWLEKAQGKFPSSGNNGVGQQSNKQK